jgi:hypothetical protein
MAATLLAGRNGLLVALCAGDASASLGEGQNPNAPAVKREAEEDWGR